MGTATEKYRLSAVLFICWFASYLDRFVINMALPFIGSYFKLDAASLGLLLSTFFIGYSLVQLPGGWLADKIGFRKMIIFSIGMFTVFSASTGLAWSVSSLFVIRFLFGIFEGCFAPASFKAVAEGYPKPERARIQSVLLATNPLSLVVAPLIAAPLIVALGWRAIFFITSLIGIMAVVLFIFYGKTGNTSNNEHIKNPSGTNWRVLLSDINILKITVINFGINTLIWGFFSWLPTYLLKVLKLDLMSVGIIASLPGLAGIIGMLAGGWLADMVFDGKEKYLLILSTGLAALSLFLMVNTTSLPLIIGCQILVAFSIKIAFATVWALPLKMIDAQNMGAASGIVNLGSQLSGVAAPTIMGFLIVWGKGSYTGAFCFLACCSIACAVVAMTIHGSKTLNQAYVKKSI